MSPNSRDNLLIRDKEARREDDMKTEAETGAIQPTEAGSEKGRILPEHCGGSVVLPANTLISDFGLQNTERRNIHGL